MMKASSVAFSIVLATAKCPPEAFHSIDSINLTTYASNDKPWYIQQQAETKYLPKEQNFCVSASYTLLDKKTFWGYDVKVHNVAYEKDGTVHDSNRGGDIKAKIVDAKTGKLEVAPGFLPTFLAGPYWVLDYDEAEGFTIVSGGAPKEQGEGGLCRTGKGTNNAGLWIFTRQQTRNETLVQKARKIAESKGLDLTVLNDVDQTNCPQRPLQDAVCPGSATRLPHAHTQATATTSASCSDVHAEIIARASGAQGWIDPHNGGIYSVLGSSDRVINTKRTTNPKKSVGGQVYVDRQRFTLTQTVTGCQIEACSESQGPSWKDFSTNYCDMRNLYCGSGDSCKIVKNDFATTERFVKAFSGQHDFSQCIVKKTASSDVQHTIV